MALADQVYRDEAPWPSKGLASLWLTPEIMWHQTTILILSSSPWKSKKKRTDRKKRMEEQPALSMLLEVPANTGQKIGILIDLASDTKYITYWATNRLKLRSEKITFRRNVYEG